MEVKPPLHKISLGQQEREVGGDMLRVNLWPENDFTRVELLSAAAQGGAGERLGDKMRLL